MKTKYKKPNDLAAGRFALGGSKRRAIKSFLTTQWSTLPDEKVETPFSSNDSRHKQTAIEKAYRFWGLSSFDENLSSLVI